MSTAKRAFLVTFLAAYADEGVSIDNFLTKKRLKGYLRKPKRDNPNIFLQIRKNI